MHKELLSDRDRIILKTFLDTSEKEQGFRLVKFKLLKRFNHIKSDFQLMDEAFKKIQGK